jgi:hypothetical protein
MRVAIHQPQYLPYLGFFHKLVHSDVFVLLDRVQFQKNGLQNRNKIKTRQGWQWLTVPVLHEFGQSISQVRLNSRVPWTRKHYNALVTNYSRAPYFEQYASSLSDILAYSHDGLCSLDCMLLFWMTELLQAETRVVLASELPVNGGGSELLVSICRSLGAKRYLSGPGGARYMDLSLFEQAGIRVDFQHFEPEVYPQQFPDAGFVPNLSVVDALFNCGPQSVRRMLG